MITPQELFSLFSDETRLRCLLLIQKRGEICVCEISQILEMVQPKISRHLALLRQSGFVLDERRGQWVYYSLNPSLPRWVKKITEAMLENLRKEEPFHSDLKKIKSSKKENLCNPNKTTL